MITFLACQTVLLAITVILLWRRVAWLEEMVIRISQPSISGVESLEDWPTTYGRMENGNLVVDEASMRQCRGRAGPA